MLTHLLELRRRAGYTLLCFGVLFLIFFLEAEPLFHFITGPLLAVLPHHEGLIATDITSAVFTPLKLAANAALLCGTPFALYHLWRFVSPGLYQKERSLVRRAILMSIVLFASGVLFCFYVVLPLMFHFFAQAVPRGVRLMPDMAYALDFSTRMLLLFGLCFQVPLVCVFLVRIQLLDAATLKNIRPYMIVAAFTLGMLFTPPDVFSQIMLALPLCMLYELGIILASNATKAL